MVSLIGSSDAYTSWSATTVAPPQVYHTNSGYVPPPAPPPVITNPVDNTTTVIDQTFIDDLVRTSQQNIYDSTKIQKIDLLTDTSDIAYAKKDITDALELKTTHFIASVDSGGNDVITFNNERVFLKEIFINYGLWARKNNGGYYKDLLTVIESLEGLTSTFANNISYYSNGSIDNVIFKYGNQTFENYTWIHSLQLKNGSSFVDVMTKLLEIDELKTLTSTFADNIGYFNAGAGDNVIYKYENHTFENTTYIDNLKLKEGNSYIEVLPKLNSLEGLTSTFADNISYYTNGSIDNAVYNYGNHTFNNNTWIQNLQLNIGGTFEDASVAVEALRNKTDFITRSVDGGGLDVLTFDNDRIFCKTLYSNNNLWVRKNNGGYYKDVFGVLDNLEGKTVYMSQTSGSWLDITSPNTHIYKNTFIDDLSIRDVAGTGYESMRVIITDLQTGVADRPTSAELPDLITAQLANKTITTDNMYVGLIMRANLRASKQLPWWEITARMANTQGHQTGVKGWVTEYTQADLHLVVFISVMDDGPNNLLTMTSAWLSSDTNLMTADTVNGGYLYKTGSGAFPDDYLEHRDSLWALEQWNSATGQSNHYLFDYAITSHEAIYTSLENKIDVDVANDIADVYTTPHTWTKPQTFYGSNYAIIANGIQLTGESEFNADVVFTAGCKTKFYNNVDFGAYGSGNVVKFGLNTRVEYQGVNDTVGLVSTVIQQGEIYARKLWVYGRTTATENTPYRAVSWEDIPLLIEEMRVKEGDKIATNSILTTNGNFLYKQSPAPLCYVDEDGKIGSAHLYDAEFIDQIIGEIDVDGDKTNQYSAGLCPASAGEVDKYLRADGSWTTIPTYSVNNLHPGTSILLPGLIPIGNAGDTNLFLAGDGVWRTVILEDANTPDFSPITAANKVAMTSLENGGKIVYSTLNTDLVNEGNNLYYTDERADARATYILQAGVADIVANEIQGQTIIANSDIRLKSNIKKIGKTCIDDLIPVEYTFKKDTTNRKRFGLIAQDLEEEEPSLVYEDDEGMKGVNYLDIIALLIKEIQVLKERVIILEKK